MHWSEFARAQPRLARLGRERLIGPGVVLVATIRRDGTPRVSPVEPLVLDGDLWLSTMWQSTKARDLLRDSRGCQAGSSSAGGPRPPAWETPGQ